jgi:hypothetical protein
MSITPVSFNNHNVLLLACSQDTKDDNLIINGINTYYITKPPYSFHPLHEVQGRYAYLLI